MKKTISLSFLVCIMCFPAFPSEDNFFNVIQWNTIYSACIGQYSSSEAGSYSPDPYDYYTPSDLSSYLSAKSGRKTRTNTFYGVCFDYAYAAYFEILEQLNSYQSAGLYENAFYIACTDDDPSTIKLYKPSSYSSSDIVMNGENLKFEATMNILAHKIADGQRATHHAWIWIKRNDGVWFWCDPTWTDNTGYVVIGYVNEYGEEVQLKPDVSLCKNYPAYLESLSSVPSRGKTLISSRQTPPISTTENGSKEAPSNNNNSYLYDTYFIFSAGWLCHNFMDAITLNEIGLSLSVEGGSVFVVPIIFQVDYFRDYDADRLLFNLNIGIQGSHWFTLYAGAGYGSYIAPLPGTEVPDIWKINFGIRMIEKNDSIRFDLSYLSDTGCVFGIYAGIGL